MIHWLRRLIALWGWVAYEHTKRIKIFTINKFRHIQIRYTYNGNVDITVYNDEPRKMIANLKVKYPNLNTIEFKNYLEDEENDLKSEYQLKGGE